MSFGVALRAGVRLLAALVLLFVPALQATAAESLRVAGDRLFVEVEINGVATSGLLDSAAEMTLIDAAFAARLGLAQSGADIARGTGGVAEVTFAEHVDIRSSGVSMPDRVVAIIDLSDVSARLVGEAVDVVVGRELFDSGRFFLDIEQGVFRRVERSREPGGVRVALRDHKGIKQVPVRIEDGDTIHADFDLGNGSEVLVGESYAAGRGLLTAERVVGTKAGGGIGGSIDRNVVVLESLELAGVTFEDVAAAIDPTDDAPAANIGVSILRHFVLTIDFPQNTLWLERR